MADDDQKTPPFKAAAPTAPAKAPDPPKKEESDEDRSKRRSAELAAHLTLHKERVAEAHRRHPSPEGVKFTRLDRQQKIDRNLRRKLIDEHNAAYAAAVKKTCGDHRAEDAALASIAAERAKALAAKEAA
jgi:hypothetical protein